MLDDDSKLIFESYNEILKEQDKYHMTPRQAFHNVYGKDNAESLIAAQKEYAKQNKNNPVSKSAQQTYALPDYSNKTLDKKTPIELKHMNPMYNAQIKKGLLGDKIAVNINNPRADLAKKELQGKSTSFDPIRKKYIAGSALGHELTHASQKVADIKQKGGNPNVSWNHKMDQNYTTTAGEFPAHIHDLKAWYYNNTKKLLPANVSEKDINEFIKFYNANKPDNNYDKVIELLNTPEGKETFRRVVVSPNNKNLNIV